MKFSVVVAEAWRSLTASLSTTLAAALTVLIGMFLVGLLIALGTWAAPGATMQKGKLDVKVYFCTETTCEAEATTAQINAVRLQLAGRSAGRSRSSSSRRSRRSRDEEEASPRWSEIVPSNPLPDSVQGHAEARVRTRWRSRTSLDPPPPGVEKVNYGKKTATRSCAWPASSRGFGRSRS